MSLTTHNRPLHLPDYSNPPLNEVVLGIQFAPPNKYQQIYSGEVWKLYRDKYVRVEEQAPIDPAFETFGLNTFLPAGQFKFLTGANHDRFWFLSESGADLIQFQNDRFLHNWRAIPGLSNKYPRFENMLSEFKDETFKLQNYMQSLSDQMLSVNQCEVSYINNIVITDDTDSSPSRWLSFCNFETNIPDDFNFTFREVIRNSDGTPQGRLIVEATTGLNKLNQNIIRLSLTVRGAPKENTIDSALNFIEDGRNIIVTKFTDLTTNYAHEKWERLK